jgi:integrase
MKAADLFRQVESYLGFRRAIGYTIHSEEKLLKDFVRFLDAQNLHGVIRSQMAVDWACTPAPGRGPAGQGSRLKVVRGFLSYLRATWPEIEVPGPGVLAPIRRPMPHIYSAGEIDRLLNEASRLRPKDSLRPYTYGTLIGLLASSGLRVGEALRLKVEDVRLDVAPPYLRIVEGKFRKSRLVPLHGTTAEKMTAYIDTRKLLHYDALSDFFFVSEQGGASAITHADEQLWG